MENTTNNITRTINFLDADRNLVTLKFSTEGGYFSFTSEVANSSGQARFNPAAGVLEPQTELLKLWDAFHLKNLSEVNNPKDIIDDVLYWMDDAVDDYEAQRNESVKCSEMDEETLLEWIAEEIAPVNDLEAKRLAAIGVHFDLTLDELKDDVEQSRYDDTTFEIQGRDYLVCTDEEADAKWDEGLENYIDDCVIYQLPEQYQNYFDREAFKRDARFDGRGHSLNRYDGSEDEVKFAGEWFFIYRQ